MSDNITVRGYVATDVRQTVANSGLPIASFRMCSTERRFDRTSNTWVDGHTNWYTVSMFRQLAMNAGISIKKGDRVVISGRLRVRPWINEEGKTGTTVEIDADTAGHDLMWGTANFRRSTSDKNDDAAHRSDQGTESQHVIDPTTGEILKGTPPGEEEQEHSDAPDPDDDESSDADSPSDKELSSAAAF